MRLCRVASRKRRIRPTPAPALSSADAPSGSVGSVSVPTTRICLSSIVTDGAPVNQPSGSLPANQPAIVSVLAMITTLPRARDVQTHLDRPQVGKLPGELNPPRPGEGVVPAAGHWCSARLRRRCGYHHVIRGRVPGGGPPGEGGLDGRRQPLHLLALLPLVALLELGHDLIGEQLAGFAYVLVPVAAGLAHEDHLVDAHGFVAAEELTDLVGTADGPSERAEPLFHQPGRKGLALPGGDAPVESELGAALLKFLPDVGAAGRV